MLQSGAKLDGREVWRRLLEGNRRFVKGEVSGRNLGELRRVLSQGQSPGAAVLGCADSRVPPELIFDQSLGDLFVVRTAGLVLEPTTLGSLEYAVAHLRVPLLVLLGHEACGAVTAAVAHPGEAEGHTGAVLKQIAPAVQEARQTGKQGAELVEAATDRHLGRLEEDLRRQSAIFQEALAAGRLSLVVAKYFLTTGDVQVLKSTF